MAVTSGIRFNQIKAADRKGNGSQAQAFGGGTTNGGEFVLYDANGNVVSSGAKGTAKGDLLVYDGSAWKDLAVGSDGTVLTARSSATAGVDWETSTGGGSSGSTTSYPDCQPSNPQTFGGASDDEFTGASLNSAWTLLTSGAGTVATQYNSSFATSAIAAKLIAAGSSSSFASGARIQRSFGPGSSDFQITIKCHLPNDAIGHGCYLYLTQESAWQNGLRFAIEPQNSTHVFNYSYISAGTWTFSAASTGSFSNQNSFEGSALLHVQRKSGTYYMYVSHDGLQWTTVASNRSDVSFTLNYLALGMEQWQNTPALPNRWLLVDWVRFNWIDLLS